MRIFKTDSKTNFVDINDVLVGLDAYQSCCESFGHFFIKEIPEQPLHKVYDSWTDEASSKDDYSPTNLEDLVFDPDFFQEQPDGDGGGFAIFRLHSGDDESFLVLYNHHNGYYGHGFTVTHKGTDLRDGCL
jgi:hypothetical protein